MSVIQPNNQDTPVLVHGWNAHNLFPIVSIACAEHSVQNAAKYVITASVDMTSKLWTIDGIPIGTFGQVRELSLNL